MSIDTTQLRSSTFSHPAAGLFTDREATNDAIYDLAQAGFTPREIVVAYSTHGEQHQHAPGLEDKHSIEWRLRHGFQHDLQRRGADQMTGDDAASGKPPLDYSEMLPHPALLEMGLSEERIALLDRELGKDGALIFVRTDDRIDKAERIIELNEGRVKTDTATEHMPPGGES